MPIITEPKKLSMPQQVQKNKEDIESIFEKIDGLDSLDNVVVVPDMSYILTADELKSVRQPVAFIVYNNKLFFKKKEENGNAYFDLVFSIALSTVVSFESEEIEVNLTNGALGITLATVNTYSVSQIDNKFATLTYVNNALGQKASLSGASFTGAITAPSIIENMIGYTFTKNTTFNWTAVFAAPCKNGNKVTFVVFGQYVYTSGDNNGLLGSFEIPSSVGSKLHPYTQGWLSTLDLRELSLFDAEYTTALPKKAIIDITKSSNTKIEIDLRALSSAGLTEGKTYNFRYEVTFLLTDNLAQ